MIWVESVLTRDTVRAFGLRNFREVLHKSIFSQNEV